MKLTDKQKEEMIFELVENMEFWHLDQLLEYAQACASQNLINLDDKTLKEVYDNYIKEQTTH